MGLFGKLKSGFSSASKHLKKRHFKMTAAELAENWKKLSSAGSIYISFKEKSEPYELDSVRRVKEGGREIIEIWYFEVEEEESAVYERQRRRVEPRLELWVHLSEAQYEKLVEKHGDFLREFEA